MEYTISKFLGYSIREYEILDSTNTQANRVIAEGLAQNNLVITSNIQSAGRGRNSRDWVSDEGNLFVSFIFDVSKENHPEYYSYFSALAVIKLLENQGLKPSLKWPNDILIDGSKICGILLEKDKNHLVRGIGLNLISSPDYLINKKTISLKDLNILFEKETAIKKICKNFDEIIKKYQSKNFDEIVELINKYLIKGKADIDFSGVKISGEILSIDENGKMNFLTESAIKKISSGEVFFQ